MKSYRVIESGEIRDFTELQISLLMAAKVIWLCPDCRVYHTTSLGWKKVETALSE